MPVPFVSLFLVNLMAWREKVVTSKSESSLTPLAMSTKIKLEVEVEYSVPRSHRHVLEHLPRGQGHQLQPQGTNVQATQALNQVK